MSHVLKVFLYIVHERIIEKELDEYQFEFLEMDSE